MTDLHTFPLTLNEGPEALAEFAGPATRQVIHTRKFFLFSNLPAVIYSKFPQNLV